MNSSQSKDGLEMHLMQIGPGTNCSAFLGENKEG